MIHKGSECIFTDITEILHRKIPLVFETELHYSESLRSKYW